MILSFAQRFVMQSTTQSFQILNRQHKDNVVKKLNIANSTEI